MNYRLQVVPKRRRRSSMKMRIDSSNGMTFQPVLPQDSRGDDKPAVDLPPQVSRRLQEISARLEFAKGDVLFFEGEKPEGVYVVEQGRVKLSANSADGRSLLVRMAETGEIIGLAAAISGKPSEVTAESQGRAACNFIGRDAFLQFLQQHGQGALRVAEILAEIYQATLSQVRYLGFSASTSEKLARFLLDLQESSARDKEVSSPIRMTHKEIGAMIGASRETVTRMVARFKKDRLVSMDGNDLRIINRAGLERMVGS